MSSRIHTHQVLDRVLRPLCTMIYSLTETEKKSFMRSVDNQNEIETILFLNQKRSRNETTIISGIETK